MNKVVGIIQARMGSSRLPGKMMMDLCGYPVLQWVIERCKRAKTLDDIVVATTTNAVDDQLSFLAHSLRVKVFRGSEEDVLGRFIEAARLLNATFIVRICADRVLVSPEEIDRLVQFYQSSEMDYAFNHIPELGNNYPVGLGAEILSSALLLGIGELAETTSHREHVTIYLWEHRENFKIWTLPCPKPYNQPSMKLDIDTIQDLKRMRALCKSLKFVSTSTEIFSAWSSFDKETV